MFHSYQRTSHLFNFFLHALIHHNFHNIIYHFLYGYFSTRFVYIFILQNGELLPFLFPFFNMFVTLMSLHHLGLDYWTSMLNVYTFGLLVHQLTYWMPWTIQLAHQLTHFNPCMSTCTIKLAMFFDKFFYIFYNTSCLFIKM